MYTASVYAIVLMDKAQCIHQQWCWCLKLVQHTCSRKYNVDENTKELEPSNLTSVFCQSLNKITKAVRRYSNQILCIIKCDRLWENNHSCAKIGFEI